MHAIEQEFCDKAMERISPRDALNILRFSPTLSSQAAWRAVGTTWMGDRLANIYLQRSVSGRPFFLRLPWCLRLRMLLSWIHRGIGKNLGPSVARLGFSAAPRRMWYSVAKAAAAASEI